MKSLEQYILESEMNDFMKGVRSEVKTLFDNIYAEYKFSPELEHGVSYDKEKDETTVWIGKRHDSSVPTQAIDPDANIDTLIEQIQKFEDKYKLEKNK